MAEVERVITRVTSRIADDYSESKVQYPPLAYAVQEKIANFMTGLKGLPLIEGHGKDGLVVSVTYEGGDVYEHKDPPVATGVGLRCNILMSVPESGGTLWIDDVACNVGAGDLHCYLVTEYKHRVDVCHGPTPRVMFMYGWCVDKDDWESGKHLPFVENTHKDF